MALGNVIADDELESYLAKMANVPAVRLVDPDPVIVKQVDLTHLGVLSTGVVFRNQGGDYFAALVPWRVS